MTGVLTLAPLSSLVFPGGVLCGPLPGVLSTVGTGVLPPVVVIIGVFLG